jgi:hypothetical protein
MSPGWHTRFTRHPRAPRAARAACAPAAAHRAPRARAAAALGLLTGFALLSGLARIAAGAVGDAADDIRDIRGPKFVWPAWLLAAAAAAVVLLAVAAYALWRWHRWRRRPRQLLPFEITLQRLEALRPLMQPATVREYSIAISDIVRGHIEQAFEVTATHRTTEEFLHDLLDTSNAALAAHRPLLAEFLNRCDEAKFAGMSLSQAIMESLQQSARSFVIESSKPPAPGASPGIHDSLPAT